MAVAAVDAALGPAHRRDQQLETVQVLLPRSDLGLRQDVHAVGARVVDRQADVRRLEVARRS